MIQWWQQILPIWNAKHRQNPLLFAQRVNSNLLAARQLENIFDSYPFSA
jgi:hypothetical protein